MAIIKDKIRNSFKSGKFKEDKFSITYSKDFKHSGIIYTIYRALYEGHGYEGFVFQHKDRLYGMYAMGPTGLRDNNHYFAKTDIDLIVKKDVIEEKHA